MTVTTCTPLPVERVEIDRQRRDQRLAFAGPHLGDRALVEHHAADQLHVEMAHAQGALAGFAHHRESRDQQVVELLAVRQFGPEFGGLGFQFRIAQLGHLRFERIDGVDLGLIFLDLPVVGRAEDRLGDRGENHGSFLVLMAPFFGRGRRSLGQRYEA